jgi:hypothetical protein
MLPCGAWNEAELAKRWGRGRRLLECETVCVRSLPATDCSERLDMDRDVFGRRQCVLDAEMAESRREFSVLDNDLIDAAGFWGACESMVKSFLYRDSS